MTNLEHAILRCIGVGWIPHPIVVSEVGYGRYQDFLAKLDELIERREIWRSYEASLIDGKPVLTARYCLAHEVGDPPIGKRVRPVMMEMA